MQDLVDATCEPPRSRKSSASPEHDPSQELLDLLGRRGHRALESSSARASPRATTREDSQPRPREETANPDGDLLGRIASARSLLREQAAARQASGSAPERHAAAPAYAGWAYQPDRSAATDDDPGSYESDPPAGNPLLWDARVPRRAALAIAASILIATLGALGYFAFSPSNTTVPSPVIADNVVEEKTATADQKAAGEERREPGPSASASDLPKTVRTVTFHPDSGAASAPAVPSSLGARSELNVSASGRAYSDAGERHEIGAASASAAGLSDPRSGLNTPPLPRARPNADQQTVRTNVALTEVPARNGSIACQTAAGRGGYWAWRMIDGKKCWYEGKVGMSKDNLRWARSAE